MGGPMQEGPKRVEAGLWVTIMVLVGLISTALLWWLWPNCWLAWMAGYAAAAALAYILCRRLFKGPFDIPVDDPVGAAKGPRRFRILDCDPEKHLKRLRVKYKPDPQAPLETWEPPEPIDIPFEPPIPPQDFFDWEVPDNVPDIFGIQVSILVDGDWTDTAVHEQAAPMHECTVRVDAGLQVSIIPEVLLPHCGR